MIETTLAKRLYEQYGFIILRTCLRILGSEDEAKDALQIVFVKLLEGYDSIQDKEKVVPWVFRAAKNHCFTILRDRKKFDTGYDLDDAASIESIDDLCAKNDIIMRVLSLHNQKVRDAVYYTYIEPFDQIEIQKITGQSPATVRRNLKRFTNSLPAIRKRLGLL